MITRTLTGGPVFPVFPGFPAVPVIPGDPGDPFGNQRNVGQEGLDIKQEPA